MAVPPPDLDAQATATTRSRRPVAPADYGVDLPWNRVICAPWNRLAYKENGGGPPRGLGRDDQLDQRGAGYTKADTLADMLDQIYQHLSASPGMYP